MTVFGKVYTSTALTSTYTKLMEDPNQAINAI